VADTLILLWRFDNLLHLARLLNLLMYISMATDSVQCKNIVMAEDYNFLEYFIYKASCRYVTEDTTREDFS